MNPTLSMGDISLIVYYKDPIGVAHPLQCQEHGCLSSHTVANQDAGHQAQLWEEALKVQTHGLIACIWTVGAVTVVPSIHCQHLGWR